MMGPGMFDGCLPAAFGAIAVIALLAFGLGFLLGGC